MVRTKRKAHTVFDDNIETSPKKRRINRMQKMSNNNKRKRLGIWSQTENKSTKQCTNIDVTNAYLSLNHGMVSYTTDYIQYLKETCEKRSYIGKPEYSCKHCDAFFWFDERNIDDSRKTKQIIYSNCCKHGQIKIPPFKKPPDFLFRLVNNKHEPISKHFLAKIRQYNSLFAFTSMGGNIDKEINSGAGPYVFHINGQVHHRIGSLLLYRIKFQNLLNYIYLIQKMKFKIEYGRYKKKNLVKMI
jgi:hypothetical protein